MIISRITKNYEPSSLGLRFSEGYLLQSKDNWRYLEFIFDRINIFISMPTKLCLLLKV